jgi:hypothetical protein
MSITRRKLLGLLPVLTAGFIPAIKAEPEPQPDTIFGYRLHDEVSWSLLKTYARSLTLVDSDARWEAQMMFHEAQLARRQGGTEGHRLGYRHKEALEAYERGEEPNRVGPLWRGWKS